MANSPEDSNPYVSRRRVVQMAAGGTVALLAGCSGDGGDGSGDGRDGSGDGGDGSDGGGDGSDGSNGDGTATEADGTRTPVDATLRTFERHWMNEANLNPFSNSPASGIRWHFFTQLAMYSSGATFDQDERVSYNEFQPMGAEDWSVDDGTWTITLRDDWEWTSGDPVTASDLALRLRLMEYEDAMIWKYIDGVSESDERTLALELNDSYDPDLLQHTLFGASMQLDTPTEIDGETSQFAATLEKLQDASSQSAEDEAFKELVDFNWYPQDATLSGPYAVTDVSKSELVLERHDGFYDPVDFTNVSMKTLDLGQTGSPSQAISTGDIDISDLPTPEVAASFPDSVHTVARQGTSGVGYGLNYEDPGGGVLTERNLRRAIAFLLSSENASQNSNPLKAGVLEEPPTGIVGASDWIDSDTLEQFDSYDVDTSKAESLMQEAGLSNDGGTWMTPDGEPLSIEVTTAPWHFYPAMGQTVVQVLQDFGIESNLNSLGSDAFVNTMWGDGSFTSAIGAWGGAHPANAFDGVFGETNVWGTPAELEVPMPIGDPDGSLETIDVRERTAQLADLSGDELQSEVETLAWAFNQNLPIIPLATENNGMAYSADGWAYPDRENPVWGTGRPREALFSNGLVDPE